MQIFKRRIRRSVNQIIINFIRYSFEDNKYFKKDILHFTNVLFYVDGTELGELLPLSKAPYLQGNSQIYKKRDK